MGAPNSGPRLTSSSPGVLGSASAPWHLGRSLSPLETSFVFKRMTRKCGARDLPALTPSSSTCARAHTYKHTHSHTPQDPTRDRNFSLKNTDTESGMVRSWNCCPHRTHSPDWLPSSSTEPWASLCRTQWCPQHARDTDVEASRHSLPPSHLLWVYSDVLFSLLDLDAYIISQSYFSFSSVKSLSQCMSF